MSAARGLVSDFGGVLTSPLAGAFARLQADSDISFEALGQAMAAMAAAEGEHPLFELERGRITEPEFIAGLERELARVLGREVHLHEFAERYFAGLEPNHDLFAYYRELHGRGLRLALCTNNVREWEPRWRTMFPFEEIFSSIVDSAFVGVRKPDPEIYAITLERIGLPAEEVVFVDDVDVNVEAARAAGMRAVHYVDTEQAIPLIDAALL